MQLCEFNFPIKLLVPTICYRERRYFCDCQRHCKERKEVSRRTYERHAQYRNHTADILQQYLAEHNIPPLDSIQSDREPPPLEDDDEPMDVPHSEEHLIYDREPEIPMQGDDIEELYTDVPFAHHPNSPTPEPRPPSVTVAPDDDEDGFSEDLNPFEVSI